MPFVGIKLIDIIVTALGVSDATFVRQLRPALLVVASCSRDRRARLPAGRHRDRPGARSTTRPTARSSRSTGWSSARADRPDVQLDPKYFQSAPSAAGDGYDGSAQLGLEPRADQPRPARDVEERVAAYREENGLADDHRRAGRRRDRVGLGPRPAHLGGERPAARPPGSPPSAGRRRGRRPRVDRRAHHRPALGVLGEPGVKVLRLNLRARRAAGHRHASS